MSAGIPAFARIEASASGIVEAEAETAWRAIVDWGGFPLRAKMPGVTGCVLVADAATPTRRISFANGLTVTEALIHHDDHARRLYCRTIDEGAAPWRNYLATLIVDALGARRCRITVRGWCDLAEAENAEAIKGFLEQNWSDGLIAGVRRALSAGR